MARRSRQGETETEQARRGRATEGVREGRREGGSKRALEVSMTSHVVIVWSSARV